MSDGNGQQKNGAPNAKNLAVTGDGQRDGSGRFLPGHKGIGGRPRLFDLPKVARKMAKAKNINLKDALWEVLWEQIKKARETGDTAAAKVVFDQLAEQQNKGPSVAVQMNQTTTVGEGTPKPPTGKRRAWWIERMRQIHDEDGGD